VLLGVGMNYFRVQSALIVGIQAIPVQVECAQARRLPYLQIIGGGGKAASELRERVMAALDSCRLRIPARRITVQLQPPAHGLPLDHLDLAVAMAILGSCGMIPTAKLENVLVCGALGLDGGLRNLAYGASLRRLLRQGAYRSALLPWFGSEILEEEHLEAGGGFRSLREVVDFARGDQPGRRMCLDPEGLPPPPHQIWERIEGQGLAKRMLEVAAAGAHHLLLPGPRAARADLLAHALSALLPPLGSTEMEEVRSVYSLAGMEFCPSRPFFSYASSPGLPPLLPDRRLSKVEEVLLAHRGVFLVGDACERESLLFPGLLGPMSTGKLQSRVGGRRMESPAEAIVVATTAACACGALGDPKLLCSCRPTEAKRFRGRWRKLLQYPFDLFLQLSLDGATEVAGDPFSLRAERVQLARARMVKRQGKWNSRLSEEEAFAHKAWGKSAQALWKALAARQGSSSCALARVALTVCDLRGGEAVEDKDLLEAKHYVGVGEEGPGKRLASSSVPEVNSMAMP
jgi:magnesium chelatase family protein